MREKTLLFVDDEQGLLDVCKKFFSLKKYRVLTASSAGKGLEVVDHQKPDLVVLDLRMPELDGMDMLRKLRSYDQKTKVIILTGYGTINEIDKGIDLGVSEFIGKPFDLNALSKAIQKTLHQ